MELQQISLFGDEFDQTKAIIEKVKKPKEDLSLDKKLKSKKVSIEEKLRLIKDDVNRILGAYAENTLVIRDYNEFVKYIDKAIEVGYITIDTETNNSLDIFGNDFKIMGLCLYVEGLKQAYIPVNHIKYHLDLKGEIIEDGLLDNQITEEQIKIQLERLNNTKIIFHNASFDIETIQQTCGVRLHAYWDTLVGAHLLDENELKGLKSQYKLHIDNSQEKYDIEHLFKGLPYSIFEPELFALYAATDSFITKKLYDYQIKEFEKDDNAPVYELLKTVELPLIDVIVDMETTGMLLDTEFGELMSTEYHKKADEIQTRIDKELDRLKPLIDKWKLTKEANEKQVGRTGKLGKSKVEQLADPIELGSSTQLSILLYDILNVPVVDYKSPRGTGADILKTLAEEKHIKICELMLEKRGVDILINTFIDALPTFIKSDGRVHSKLNQCGTATGRMSSSSFNQQQIPSHDKTIRMMFKPTDGYAICGSDFSGQEVRILASASNDQEMIKAYAANKDLYAQIGSLAFKVDYEDCLEFDPRNNGQQNPEGKARRSKSKTLLLGRR